MKSPLTLIREFQTTRAMKRECVALARQLAGRTQPAPPALVEVADQQAVWRVAVPGQADRLMSATMGALDDEMFVVRVDTEAFYAAWLQSSATRRERNSADCVRRKDMPSDYKYCHAVQGFAVDAGSPVPLALASAYCRKDGSIVIGFTNGVTRSFWLIANKAESFPLQVHGREAAELLNKAVGLDPEPQTLGQVFASAQLQRHSSQEPPHS